MNPFQLPWPEDAVRIRLPALTGLRPVGATTSRRARSLKRASGRQQRFAMEFPDHPGAVPKVIVNPVLVLTGFTVPGREGCLSLPNLFEQVYRAEGVVMKYSDPLGVEGEVTLTEMEARIVQHETDHLDGIMFFDYKDKREKYVTPEYPTPRGARMTKNLQKHLLREWEKKNGKH